MGLQVATGTRKQLGENLYMDMLRMRHEVFVQRLQWDLPSCHNGLAEAGIEVDEFDRGDTLYTILHEHERVLASCRLISDTSKMMVTKLWPDVLLDCPLASWELSRLAIDKTAPHRSLLTAQLLLAAYRAGVERGVHDCIMVCSHSSAKAIKRIGVELHAIPTLNRMIAAFKMRVNERVGHTLQSAMLSRGVI